MIIYITYYFGLLYLLAISYGILFGVGFDQKKILRFILFL